MFPGCLTFTQCSMVQQITVLILFFVVSALPFITADMFQTLPVAFNLQ